MWYDMKSYERKCTFRYMLVDQKNCATVITQDLRRSFNIITGDVYLGVISYNMQQYYAKQYGCNAIIRFKSYREMSWKNKPLKCCIS